MRPLATIISLLLLAAPPAAEAAVVMVEVTADNSIIDVSSEHSFNMGAVSSLRLKSFQHHLLLDFDTEPVEGLTVLSARLRATPNASRLKRVTISTVQADWGEGSSTTFGTSEGGSTFLHARHSSDPAKAESWAWPGSDFSDVVYGNGFSLTGESSSEVSDGTYLWEVPPALIEAVAIGASFGLAVFESDHDVSRNPTVFSKESGSPPYLEVELGPPVDAPPAPSGLSERADLAERGEAVLELEVPERAFAYDVTVAGNPLPRYQIPFAAAAGSRQQIRIRDLLGPGESAAVEVVAISRSGARSEPASFQVTASERAAMPAGDFVPSPPPQGGAKLEEGGLLVWAAPETDRIRPDGSIGDGAPAGYATANGRFSGGRVALAGARGEIVAFVLVLEAADAAVRGLDLELKAPSGMAARAQAVRSVQTSAGPLPELLLSGDSPPGPRLKGLATDGDTGAPGAKVQLVLVEIDVPAGAAEGGHAGSLEISGGASLSVPVEVTVLPFDMPEQPTFQLDLNTYGFPSYYATFGAVQRLAHRFRANVNYLHYGHGGRTRMDMIREDGSLMDEQAYNDIAPGATEGNWEPDFTEAFEPFLTGAAFTGVLPGVPLRTFYLSFHENWPLPLKAHRKAGEMDAFAAFPEVYGRTFTDVLSSFGRHAEAKGWTRVQFQVYLNNKPGQNNQNPTPWALDEPEDLWDFKALAYFNRLHEAAGLEELDVEIPFRVDVSRPQYHRGYLDAVDLYVCQAAACFEHARMISDQRERTGFELWTYGSPSKVTQSMHHIQAWAARTFALGGNGVVPWQTVRPGADLLTGADDGKQQLALIVVEADAQEPKVHASLRLAAYRRAQQDMEILRTLERAGGFTRGQMARFVASYLEQDGASSPDGMHYGELAASLPAAGHHEAAFDAMRAHAAALIVELGGSGPPPGDQGGPPPDAGSTADTATAPDTATATDVATATDSATVTDPGLPGGDHPPPLRVCEPGATQLCHCAGAAEGAQACRDDGSGWLDCDCGEEPEPETEGEVTGGGGCDAGAAGGAGAWMLLLLPLALLLVARRRSMSAGLVALALLLFSAGCDAKTGGGTGEGGWHPPGKPADGASVADTSGAPTTPVVPTGPVRADILFVVDNSASMCEEQGVLGRNIDSLFAPLRESGRALDLRIATVTTNVMGDHAELSTRYASDFPPTCRRAVVKKCLKDDDCVRPTEDSPALPEPPGGSRWTCTWKNKNASYMVNENQSINSRCMLVCDTDESCRTAFGSGFGCQEYDANITDPGCMVSPPVCGMVPPIFEYGSQTTHLAPLICQLTPGVEMSFAANLEQGLGAAWLALDPGGPNAAQSKRFLRDDAWLVLVFVSDEDDCTVDRECLVESDGTTWADVQHLRDNCLGRDKYGVCATMGDKTTGGPLEPVATITAGIKAVKEEPSRLIVAAIVGDSRQEDEEARQKEIDAFNRSKSFPTPYAASTYFCSSDGGVADYGARYIELVESFGENGYLANICGAKDAENAQEQAFKDLLGRLGARLAREAGGEE